MNLSFAESRIRKKHQLCNRRQIIFLRMCLSNFPKVSIKNLLFRRKYKYNEIFKGNIIFVEKSDLNQLLIFEPISRFTLKNQAQTILKTLIQISVRIFKIFKNLNFVSLIFRHILRLYSKIYQINIAIFISQYLRQTENT